MPETWFAIEMTTIDGDEFYAIVRDQDALAQYVRVNSGDKLSTMKISAVDPSTLAEARIKETFVDA